MILQRNHSKARFHLFSKSIMPSNSSPYPLFVSVNGVRMEDPEREARVSIFDVSFQRGLGVFEVIKILPGGRLRAVDLHLTRMKTTASALDLVLPPDDVLTGWMQEAAAQDMQGAGSIKVIATLGSEDAATSYLSMDCAPPKIFILWQPLTTAWPATYSLLPLYAPWHAAGKGAAAAGLSSALKITSYGPNVLSTRTAKKQGFTDALLLTDAAPKHTTVREATALEKMFVLDGPNFAVGFVLPTDGLKGDEVSSFELCFPNGDELGLLRSTTQQLVIQAAQKYLPELNIRADVFRLEQILKDAKEVFVLSSTRGIIPVNRIGNTEIPLGPIVPRLKQAMNDFVQA